MRLLRFSAGKGGFPLLLLTGALVGGAADLAGASFEGLGDLPGGSVDSRAGGVSDDGEFVAGTSYGNSGAIAFRWNRATGMLPLGDLPGGDVASFGAEISKDGSVVGGHSQSASGTEAFHWRLNSGIVGLGDLVGGGFLSDVRDINGNGEVMIGIGTSGNGFPEAFRWEGGALTPLGDLPGGGFASDAYSVSRDGGVIVGGSRSSNGGEAFRWDVANGMIGLGDLPGGGFESAAVGVSGDGSVIVGHGLNDAGRVAFRWEDGTMVALGELPGGRVEATANSSSESGQVIVGSSHSGIVDPFGFGFEAFVWDPVGGLQNLKDVLENEGELDLSGWILSFAEDVASNGRVIVGTGINPSGRLEAWRAVMPDRFLDCVSLRIQFGDDAEGSYDNGFFSAQSANVAFSTLNGQVVKVFTGKGSNAGETQGHGLGGDGRFEPNALAMDFSIPVTSLQLDFGNDDP